MRPSISTTMMIAVLLGVGCLGRALAQAPASTAVLIGRAVEQMRAADWEGAAKSYESIVRDNPYRADHWHNYGYALHKTGRFAEAAPAWEQAATLGFAWDPLWERGLVWDPTWVKAFGPGTPIPWYNIARAKTRLGDKEAALRALDRAMEEGFAVEESLRSEPDFTAILADARFQRLAGSPPAGKLSREDRWRFDLDYLARRMPQVHYQLDRKISSEKFRRVIEDLRAHLPRLPDGQIVVELQRIAAMAGSAHTRIYWPESGPYAEPRYPVELYLYKDGLHVRRAAARLERAVGGRVLRIGRQTAEDALAAVAPLCSVDGPMGLKVEAPALLARPQVIAAIGLAPDPRHLALVVERRDGRKSRSN